MRRGGMTVEVASVSVASDTVLGAVFAMLMMFSVTCVM